MKTLRAVKTTKTATYNLADGSLLEVEYDPEDPCWMCGEAVVTASTSGTVVCPWCDMGKARDGRSWTAAESLAAQQRFGECRRAAEAAYEAELERQASWRLGQVPRRGRTSNLSTLSS